MVASWDRDFDCNCCKKDKKGGGVSPEAQSSGTLNSPDNNEIYTRKKYSLMGSNQRFWLPLDKQWHLE